MGTTLRFGWGRFLAWIFAVFGAGAITAATSINEAASQEFIKSVQPSVYYVFVRGQNTAGSGTGFLISGNRYIATNYHVVKGATEFTILTLHSVTFGSKIETIRRTRAQFVTALPDKDLAILKADEDLPGTPLTLAGYDPDAAAPVVAIGYPGAAEIVTRQDGMEPSDMISTVTLGNVSRVVPNAAIQAGAKLVQHTAAINPGNSGGPLFDACGAVVGVNTFGPANKARVDRNQIKITVPQGIYFSVHSAELAGLALSVGLPLKTEQTSCKPGSTPVTVAAVQQSGRPQAATPAPTSPAKAVANVRQAARQEPAQPAPPRLSAEDERRGADAIARLRSCLSTQPCDVAICDASLRRGAPAAYIDRMNAEIGVFKDRAEDMCMAERATSELANLRTCAQSKPCEYIGQCEPDVIGQWTPAMVTAREGDLGRLRIDARQACFKHHSLSANALGAPLVAEGCYRGTLRFEASAERAREVDGARCLDQSGVRVRVGRGGEMSVEMPDGDRQLTWAGKVDPATGDVDMPAAGLSIRTMTGQTVSPPQNAVISGKFWRSKIELGACGVGTLAASYKTSDDACGQPAAGPAPGTAKQ